MNNNVENDRTVTTNKMYPIDLAPQKITIVKSVSSAEVKMAHLLSGASKSTGSSQILSHASSVSLMRPAAQIISQGVVSQPSMIVGGSQILPGTQIVSQASQLLGQSSQIIPQSHLLGPNGPLISPGTQIISQGSQLSTSVSSNNNSGAINTQVSVPSSLTGTQMLNVGGQLSGAGNLVVSTSVRTPPSVRVIPPLPHNNPRQAVMTNVNVSTASGMLVNKTVTSHVPRGLAAGASLAIRPVTPTTSSQPAANQGSNWPGGTRGVRNAVVYGPRTTLSRTVPRTPSAPPPSSPTSVVPTVAVPVTVQQSPPTHAPVITLPTTSVLTSTGVMSNSLRGISPRPTTPTPLLTTPTTVSVPPRPLPLLQRNYQPKVVGVANVGIRGPVGNSAPSQLYYEVPRAATPSSTYPTLTPLPVLTSHPSPAPLPLPVHQHQLINRPVTPYPINQTGPQLNVVSSVHLPENRSSVTSTASILARPSILRKRDNEGSPSKTSGVCTPTGYIGNAVGTGWEDVNRSTGLNAGGGSGGGSTTISASSSPAHDDEPEPSQIENDVSPRKKPRKQIRMNNEVRKCEYQPDDTSLTSPPPVVNPPPKRPLLSSSYVCGWRATSLHFVRPSDVRRREPRARDILTIANQKHALSTADGWKVHHLTAQMDDLVSLEADVGDQMAGVLRALENASSRATAALQPHSHILLELLKGNIQRSKIVCEGIQEAREDILRVFTHRNIVTDILTRQADKRCFRKHRIQS